MPQAKERAFRGAADAVLMRGLIQSSWRARGPINTFHVGDLHWRLREESTRDPPRDIRLWEDGTERVIGFAWYDPPDAGDVLTHPDVADRSGLEARMLAWLEQRHLATPAPRAQRFITGGFDTDPERLALLESLGYSRTTLGYPHFELGLDEPPAEPALPPGHRVKSVTESDCAARALVHQRAWGTQDLTEPIYRAVRAAPAFRAELDVVAVAPDGRFATSCLAWLDEENRTGLFEPVGCDPEYRRRGLTRAAMLYCLGRLRELGARRAYVYPEDTNTAAKKLYESCGFRVVGIDRDWDRPLEPAP